MAASLSLFNAGSTMKNATEIHTHILLKVADDVEFRKRLAKDPKGVIEAETGREVPDDALVLIEQVIANRLEQTSVDTPLSKGEMAQVVGGVSREEGHQAVTAYCEDNPDDWLTCRS